MLNFDPKREPARPKDAATVVVVRERTAGLELFCVERHARSGFLGGAIVFPGGKVDPGDHDERLSERMTGLSQRSRALSDDLGTARAFAAAALRELLEEAAILPVVGDTLSAAALLSLRDDLVVRQSAGGASTTAFAALLSAHGLIADAGRLEAMWRWITPQAEARRYDTRFYLLTLPQGQQGVHDRHETTSSFWAAPREVLERWERGEIFLAPPTVRAIEIFRDVSTTDEALQVARQQTLDPVCPHFMLDGEHPILALPGDPLYPEPCQAPSDPHAPTRFVLRDGRFVGEIKRG